MTHYAATERESRTNPEPRSLTVVAWLDARNDATPGAHLTASDDALVWYTPILGPTAMLMAHRFAAHAVHGPTSWTYASLAQAFGMGHAAGRVPRILERLERFDIICRPDPHTIAVRLLLAPLTAHQRERLPAELAATYPHHPLQPRVPAAELATAGDAR